MKQYRVYVIANGIPESRIDTVFEKEKALLADQLGIELVWYTECKYEPVTYQENAQGMHWVDFALMSKQEQGAATCQAVIYCYDPTKHDDPGVCNWTLRGTRRPMIQIVFKDDLSIDQIFSELRHEMIHGFFANLALKGTYLSDQIDHNSPESVEIAKIIPFVDNLCSYLPVDTWFGRITMFLASFRRKSVRDMAEGMAEFEGFYTQGSRAQRNHNPGNIKNVNQPLSIGTDDLGFAIYPDNETGWIAMISLLRRKVFDQFFTGSISDVIRNWTSGDAPEVQKNYITFVSNRLGLSPDAPCRSLAWG